MKKILPIIVYISLNISPCFSQDYPDFGIPTKEEIELKECPFEKEAGAVVLIHEAFSYQGNYTELVTTHHIRIKILNDKGISAANIAIPFYSENNFEHIDNIEAMTINVESEGLLKKQKIEKKFFYKIKKTKSIGEITFAFPSVKKGSIIEYQYRSVMQNYWGLKDWYFQDDIPIMISRYHLKMIQDKQFVYRVNKRPELEITVLNEPGKLFFEMRNIPSLTDEPYMDSRKDNIQNINFQFGKYNSRWGSYNTQTTLSGWQEVYQMMLNAESFWPQLENKIKGTNDFVKQINPELSQEQKINTVYNYVRDNIDWDNWYSKSSANGVNEAWQNKSGTSGDINLILINLLRKAGVEAYPILVSQRFHGKVDTAYPYIDQFNSVFAFVNINSKKYFLDATDKHTPVYITPSSILNTIGFIVSEKKAGLIFISNDSLSYKEGIYLDMKISEDGILNGKALIRSKDYARIKKSREYAKDKEHFKENYLKLNDLVANFEKFEIENTENDSVSLNQKFDFSFALTESGNYKLIPLNLFAGFDKNPFLNDIRFSNINFGYRRNINLNTAIELPANYTVDELPKSIVMETPEKDIIYSRQVSFNKETNYVYCNIKFEFNKTYYETDFYPIVKEAYKKLFNFLKEQIVIKKK